MSDLASDFAIRRNDDGTFDGICLRCFLTVVTVQEESELKLPEQSHVCKEEDIVPSNLVWRDGSVSWDGRKSTSQKKLKPHISS